MAVPLSFLCNSQCERRPMLPLKIRVLRGSLDSLLALLAMVLFGSGVSAAPPEPSRFEQ